MEMAIVQMGKYYVQTMGSRWTATVVFAVYVAKDGAFLTLWIRIGTNGGLIWLNDWISDAHWARKASAATISCTSESIPLVISIATRVNGVSNIIGACTVPCFSDSLALGGFQLDLRGDSLSLCNSLS